MRLPIFETVLGGLTITGSIVGTHHDLEEVFALHARGKTEIERSECALDDVNDAIDAVLDGSAGTARTVLRTSATATSINSNGRQMLAKVCAGSPEGSATKAASLPG